MEWIANAISNLTITALFDVVVDFVINIVNWALTLIPADVRLWFETQYFTLFGNQLGAAGNPYQDVATAIRFGYDLLAWIMPIKAMFGLLLTVLAVIGGIRITRLILRVAPFVNG